MRLRFILWIKKSIVSESRCKLNFLKRATRWICIGVRACERWSAWSLPHFLFPPEWRALWRSTSCLPSSLNFWFCHSYVWWSGGGTWAASLSRSMLLSVDFCHQQMKLAYFWSYAMSFSSAWCFWRGCAQKSASLRPQFLKKRCDHLQFLSEESWLHFEVMPQLYCSSSQFAKLPWPVRRHQKQARKTLCLACQMAHYSIQDSSELPCCYCNLLGRLIGFASAGRECRRAARWGLDRSWWSLAARVSPLGRWALLAQARLGCSTRSLLLRRQALSDLVDQQSSPSSETYAPWKFLCCLSSLRIPQSSPLHFGWRDWLFLSSRR